METTVRRKPESSTSSRAKLLDAAFRVFARDGLHRATTRVIAEEAGVNEVTLFRHFQNKEGLLAAVMSKVMEDHARHGVGQAGDWTSSDLRSNLQRFAAELYAQMERDEAFIRTMVGEAKRQPEHARKIIMDSIRPLRTQFIQNLEAARRVGLVREGINLAAAADAFTGTLFGGMLKITASCSEGYTSAEYVATCAELFAQGLTPQPPSA